MNEPISLGVVTNESRIATSLIAGDIREPSYVALSKLVDLEPKIDRMLEMLASYLAEKGYR